MKRRRGWTGLPRGHAMWKTPEIRAAVLAARDRPLADRLTKFQDKRGPDECWPWMGGTNGVGYGVLRIHKKMRLATHVSLEVAGRPRPSEEHQACHHCDNPPCTNPVHLFWGTRSDNARDCLAKGRRPKPKPHTHCRQGHLFTPETSAIGRNGQRRCRICRNARARERAARKAAA